MSNMKNFYFYACHSTLYVTLTKWYRNSNVKNREIKLPEFANFKVCLTVAILSLRYALQYSDKIFVDVFNSLLVSSKKWFAYADILLTIKQDLIPIKVWV